MSDFIFDKIYEKITVKYNKKTLNIISHYDIFKIPYKYINKINCYEPFILRYTFERKSNSITLKLSFSIFNLLTTIELILELL